MSDRGAFIVVEGIDGCGKSTQVARLAAQRRALATFEPGATELGRSLRRILLEEALAPDPIAEALLMASDRAQHVSTVIEPTLATGRDVVSDRYAASTLAYQGSGRGLDLRSLTELMEFATRGLHPDVTILLDLSVTESQARRDGVPDRMESEHSDFFERVRAGYLELAAAAGDSWVVLDATRSVEEITVAINAALADRGL